MNRSTQRGVALVITLIMLAVVTITAVTFLAVTRRERGSVSAASDQLDARLAADAALQRAEAEVAARMISTGNRLNFGLTVSTNWGNPILNLGQLDQLANESLNTANYAIFTNATIYANANGTPIFNLNNSGDRERYRASLANLLYDPRPPVFASISRIPTVAPEFRFYLDLNRNGVFDTNGVQLAFNQRRQVIGTNELVGDPEWIGETEYPGQPHSGTNRFLKRWAYVILPAGRTLDLNYNYNDAKDRRTNGGGFARNQGFATFEANFAGMLVDLNTNVWPTNTYNYRPTVGQLSTGLAFSDADRIYRYRRGTPVQILASDFYDRQPTPFATDRIDNNGDGPVPQTLAEVRRPQDYILAGSTEDNTLRRWPGTDNQRQFIDVMRMLDGGLGGGIERRLSGRFSAAGLPLNSTYDRNTFYRLLGSVGTDTGDGRYESGTTVGGTFYRRAKLNLNYAQEGNPNLAEPNSAEITRFRDWAPLTWYTNAAHRLLQSEFANGLPDLALLTNSRTAHLGHGIAVHGTNVVRGITNIYRWDAQVHRLLQVAANLYDATHFASTARPGRPRADVPSVFRPVLYRQETNGTLLVRLAGFQEVTNALPLGRPWLDLDDRRQVLQLSTSPDVSQILANGDDFNAFGIPYVVGAKRGLPNFQEGFWQSRLDVTRRLRVSKPRATDALTATNARPWEDARFLTEAQYRIDVANTFGMEAWNSYFTLTNSTAVRLVATNYFEFAIRDENDPIGRAPRIYTNGFRRAEATIPRGDWSPQRYLSPLNTGIVTNFVYDSLRRLVFPANQTNAGYMDVRTPAPRLTVAYTNRLVYALIDGNGRVLDMVNLKSVLYETNVLRLLHFPGISGGTASMRMSQFWNTNIYAGGGFLNQGLALQFDGSLGQDRNGSVVDIPISLWRDAPGIRPAGQQREFEKDGLYYFLYRQARRPNQTAVSQLLSQFGGLYAQVGYTPTASVILTDRRQANDPLVHYTSEDLAPGVVIYTAPEGYTEIPVPGRNPLRSNADIPFAVEERSLTNHLGNRPKVVSAYAPWGLNSDLGAAAPTPPVAANSTAYDVGFKDSLITRSDDWNFPTNKFPTLGFIGRVHRGTPWQTIYLKGIRPEAGTARYADRYVGIKSWAAWAGNPRTQPTNDWAILDLFTTAVNDNTARGMLGVNQTNLAAWSAVLTGVPVLTNVNGTLSTRSVLPGSAQLVHMVQDINRSRFNFAGAQFSRMGQMFSAGALSVGPAPGFNNGLQFSPYLDPFDRAQNPVTRQLIPAAVPDEVIEQVPQQILSLVRTDEPRMVIYAFGQALKPAPNAIVTRPGPFYGLCTNYIVTSEMATRTVVRMDGAPRTGQLRAVIEDHRVLPPEN